MILFFENFIIIILLTLFINVCKDHHHHQKGVYSCTFSFCLLLEIQILVLGMKLLLFCIDKTDAFLREGNVILSGVFWFLLCKDTITKQLKVVIIVLYHFWYLVMFFLNKNITLWKKYENQTLQTDIDFQFFTWNNYSSCDSQYWNT